MIVTGAFAGATAALWATEGTWRTNLLRYSLIGIVAASTVPLFLSTIQSDLIGKADGSSSSQIEPARYLVFAGLCMLVSFYAPTYLKGLSDRILEQLKETKKQVKETQEEAHVAKKIAIQAREELKPLTEQAFEPADKEDQEP